MCNNTIIWKALSREASWNNTSACNIQFGFLAETGGKFPRNNWAMSCVNAEGNPPEHSWQNAPEPAMQEPATREPSTLEPSTTQPLPRSTVLLVPKPTWPSCCQGLRHGWCQGACHSPLLFHLSTQDWCSPAPLTLFLLLCSTRVWEAAAGSAEANSCNSWKFMQISPFTLDSGDHSALFVLQVHSASAC